MGYGFFFNQKAELVLRGCYGLNLKIRNKIINMTGTNLVGDNTFTTQNIWAGDETRVGNFWVFSIMNLSSKAILGYVISEQRHVSPEEMCMLMININQGLEKEGASYPEVLHVDMGRCYEDEGFRGFLVKANIKLSQAKGKFRNQSIESYHNDVKRRIVLNFLKQENPKQLDAQKILTRKEFQKTKGAKAKSKQVREKLFKTAYFDLYGKGLIEESVKGFNKAASIYKAFSRNQVDFYLNRLSDNVAYMGLSETSETALVKAGQLERLKKADDTLTSIIQNNPEDLDSIKFNFLNTSVNTDQAVVNLFFKGFLMLSNQNKLIFKQNEELLEKTSTIESQNKALQEQVESLSNELKIQRQKAEEKERRKQKVANRKRRNPVTVINQEMFEKMIDKIKNSNSFKDTRLKLSLMVLYVTGLRISELRFLTLKDIKSLWVRDGYLSVERLKRKGKKKKVKAFLTQEGNRIVKTFRKDFKQLTFYLNSENSFVVCSQTKQTEPLERAYFTKEGNDYLRTFDGETATYRSHSFRKTQRTSLWNHKISNL